MSSKKKPLQRELKKVKKGTSEESTLEIELGRSKQFEESDKPEESRLVEGEFPEFDSTDFSAQLSDLMNALPARSGLEDLDLGKELENAVIFAKRFSESENDVGKDYAANYNPKYNDKDYSKMTPGGYGGKSEGSSPGKGENSESSGKQ